VPSYASHRRTSSGKSLSSLEHPSFDHVPAGLGGHPLKKAMYPLTSSLFRLISSFHSHRRGPINSLPGARRGPPSNFLLHYGAAAWEAHPPANSTTAARSYPATILPYCFHVSKLFHWTSRSPARPSPGPRPSPTTLPLAHKFVIIGSRREKRGPFCTGCL